VRAGLRLLPSKVGVLQIRGELVELELPEAAVALDPVASLTQRCGDEMRPARAPLALHAGEASALEHAHVFGHGRQGHIETGRELADRLVASREPQQDRPPRRVGEPRENAIELIGAMVNHVVYYGE
jgi:hypothetical protein